MIAAAWTVAIVVTAAFAVAVSANDQAVRASALELAPAVILVVVLAWAFLWHHYETKDHRRDRSR